MIGLLLIIAAVAVVSVGIAQREALTSAFAANGGTTGDGATGVTDRPIPDRYAGTWHGSLYDGKRHTTDVELVLRAGDLNGTINYTGSVCRGTVSVQAVGSGDTTLTLQERITYNPDGQCPTGVITLTPTDQGDGQAWLSFVWRQQGNQAVTEKGDLQRQ